MMLQKANSLDKQTTVNIANYIALNKQYQLKNTFAGIMKNDYQAGVENLDFASSASVKHINQWCSKQTNGMIPSMISQLDANAVSCIMNAIYLREHGQISLIRRIRSWRHFMDIPVISRRLR